MLAYGWLSTQSIQHIDIWHTIYYAVVKYVYLLNVAYFIKNKQNIIHVLNRLQVIWTKLNGNISQPFHNIQFNIYVFALQ